MSKRSHYLLPSFLVLGGLLASAVWSADPPTDAYGSRLATFDQAAGESYFALSVTPAQRVSPAAEQDIVILADTSASQAGLFRADSLLAVRTLIERLDPKDRVKLFAVDLDAVPLTEQFVEAGSKEMREALTKLEQRTPLGATDMERALQAALDSLPGAPERPRAVIYVGDGLSRANFFGEDEIRSLVTKLVAARAAVSSLAIGPARSVEFLAVLANQTGGVIWIDSDEEASAEMGGAALAKAAQQPVLWPTEASFSEGLAEHYPSQVPPLRTDRDTILIGKLVSRDPQTITFKVEVQGETIDLSWKLAAERSNEDFGFLPRLVDQARDNGGLTLPTVGSAGLREVARMMMAGSDGVSLSKPVDDVATRPVAFHLCTYQQDPQGDPADPFGPAGDDEPAAPAPQGDPAAPAEEPAEAMPQDAPAAPAPAEEPAVEPATEPAAPVPQTDPAAPAVDPTTPETMTPETDGSDLLSELEPQAEMIDGFQVDRQVWVGKIQAEVEKKLNDARRMMATDAAAARQDLKIVLDNVDRATELDPEIRAQLRDRLVTALREAGRRQVELDTIRRQGQENLAIADESRRLAAEFTDKRARVKLLMEKYAALVDEGITLALLGDSDRAVVNFETALNDIADPVSSMLPGDSIGVSARYNAGILRQLVGVRRLREERHRGFVDAMYQVERASVPFNDGKPIIYPDPEFWERISVARQKYKSMDLLGSGTPEKRIYDALDEETPMLTFVETPLSEVLTYIKEETKIPIWIDDKALDDVGLGSDTPVTIDLAGVKLRSALNLMLKKMELTYVIRNEVLIITTPEEADSQLLTKVYPVADLVMPIMGGMGGGMMGGMGGGMGGMGGGMGGMGGGMGGMMGGGMGGGMGGMGGFFDVEDTLQLGTKPAAPTTEPASPAQPDPQLPMAGVAAKVAEPIVLAVEEGQSKAEAWDVYFRRERGDSPEKAMELDGQIRATAKVFSDQEAYGDIVAMLQSAIRHSLAQPWMYHPLSLALMATDAPQLEVERTLMSLVDLTNSQDEAMRLAVYMASIGLDQQALKLFRELAYVNPFRPELYEAGLGCAVRLDDLDGLRWATLGVLSQAWPEDQNGIEDRALRVAKATVERLRKENLAAEADAFEQAMEDARLRDVVVKVTWTGDADVDVLIEEPSGTVCSLQNPRTTSGGVLLGDTFAGGNGAEGYTETYVCPQGFAGKYRLLVRRVWGSVAAGKVTVDIQTLNPDRPHIHSQVRLADKDALVLFDVPNGRRAESLASQQLARWQTPVAKADRAALSRQLNRYEDSLAKRDYNSARARQRGWSGGGPVGFQPQITTLPQGASLSGFPSLAVVSADRRYVRTSPMPFFSQIGDVTTFDFGGGATDDDDDDDDDDDNNN